MILVVAVIAGISIALLRGGRLLRLGEQPFRLGWLAVVCFLAQVYVTFTPADQLESRRMLHAALLMGSYAALLAVVWANRRAAGMAIVGLGLLLNLTVMAANGGFMPISREAILVAGTPSVESLPPEGSRIPKTKDILLPAEQTKLAFLSDAITASAVPGAKVYSLGDLVVALGAFAFVQRAMCPRRGRDYPEGRAAEAA